MTSTLYPAVNREMGVALEALTADQLFELAHIKKAREEHAGPTWADEEHRLSEQAMACQIAWAMVVEDGHTAPAVIKATDTEFPGHHDAIVTTVEQAVTERRSR